MLLFPAVDLLGGKAVRLFQGRYDDVTVYDEHPVNTAMKFRVAGCTAIHIVDLDGARDGSTVNLDTVVKIKKETGLFCEIGGGIRDMQTVKRYLDAGLDRVILGTAAVQNPAFVEEAVKAYGRKITVGMDLRNGMVSVKGWTEDSKVTGEELISTMSRIGVKHFIITDISKDGAMKGTSLELYRELSGKYKIDITASGGISTLEDVRALREMDLYGAIIGKAYYTGAINLKEALIEAKS